MIEKLPVNRMTSQIELKINELVDFANANLRDFARYEPKVLHFIEKDSECEYVVPYRSIKCLRINNINPETGLRTITVVFDDEIITGYVTNEQEQSLRSFE